MRSNRRNKRRSHVRGFVLLLPLLVGLASACQGILGIEGWTKKPNREADAGACILASDCTGNQVCLFQTCSEPCAKDKDCAVAEYCLRTDEGTACVSNEQAQCGSQDCPAGSVCRSGHCQATCSAAAICPGGQQCSLGICVSSAPDAGNGSGGTANGGAPGAGDAGTPAIAGETGAAGAAGALGEGGAPPTVVEDGTAIGAVDAPCTNAAALACAGHAQQKQLVCQGGTWQPNGSCAGNTLCDSTRGANAGSCQPLIAECKSQIAGHRFCRGTETDLRECGADLVTAKVVDSCKFVCSAGACQGECHPADKQCKAGGLIPQTCTDAGAWLDGTACGYKCDSASGKCLAAGCGDTAKNGDETDTDCGGSCSGCGIGSACKGDADCIAPASARCINSKCAAASCSDGVKNGSETDIDCGGSCAKRCAVDQGCAVNGDCLLPDSGHCSGTKCVAASCLDGLKNGTETDKDCGGSCAADCANGLACGMDADCASAACLNTVCVACKPTTKICVNSSTQTCSATGSWNSPVACTVTNGTANCTGAGVCGLQACNSGFGDCDDSVPGCETNLNAPATCGTTCGNRVSCSSANGTPGCANGVCKPSCLPGYGDCNASTVPNDGCERQLNVVSSCGTSCAGVATCTAPQQICTNGTCVTNAAYTIGQASTTGWSEFDPPSNTWYVVPITVPKDATLQEFRTIGLADGGSTRMAIWADDGAGHPGAYIAQSATLLVTTGLVKGTSTPASPTLSGGKKYWVGAKFVNAPRMYQNSSSGAQGYTTDQPFGTAPSALSPFPTSPGTFNSTVLNFILLVQDIPP